MLSRANSVAWMSENRDDDHSYNAHHINHSNNNNNNNSENANINDGNNVNVMSDVHGVVSMATFKSMLEVENEWYNNNNNNNNNSTTNSLNFSNNNTITENNLLLNPAGIIDSSSSCSPSPSVFNPASSYLFPPSKGNIFSNNPLSSQNFSLAGCVGNAAGGFFQDVQNNNHHQMINGFGDFGAHTDMVSPSLGTNNNNSHFGEIEGFGVDGLMNNNNNNNNNNINNSNNSSLFVNRGSKILKPLDNSPPIGGQPTLFQKRAALRKSFGTSTGNLMNLGSNSSLVYNGGDGENEKKRKMGCLGMLDNVSFTGSEFNYDSDDFTENNETSNTFKGSDKNGGTNSNANSGMTGNGGGDGKGKRKGLPAKNLMAERRRRKKLNDRLYMLRSVVPKISKMDRASILGDAIEYLKELLQKINDLHNELESSPPASTLTQSTNFHPLTPTLPNLPSRIKEELCPSSLPSPNGQPARIEVRLREGRAVNIHMFCGRRPGLLLSTMRALDGLGLDIQQAVISCFNGFAMDIFRAEQCKDGQDVHPDQIKALLLELATFHGSNIVGNCNIFDDAPPTYHPLHINGSPLLLAHFLSFCAKQ